MFAFTYRFKKDKQTRYIVIIEQMIVKSVMVARFKYFDLRWTNNHLKH